MKENNIQVIDKNEDVLVKRKDLHATWLGHPCTVQLLREVENYQKMLDSKNRKLSFDPVSHDHQIRCNAFGSHILDGIKEKITVVENLYK